MATFREVRRRVTEQVRAGATLDQIDEHVIRPSGLSEEEQAAAWIIARSELEEEECGRLGYLARQHGVRIRARRGLEPVGAD